MADREGTVVHMLIDREPGYARPTVGDLVRATTEWLFPRDLPCEVISTNLAATVRVAEHGELRYVETAGPSAALADVPRPGERIWCECVGLVPTSRPQEFVERPVQVGETDVT